MVTYSSEKQPALIIFWFSIEKGVFPSIQKKKKNSVTAPVCNQKGGFAFLKKVTIQEKPPFF